MNYLLIKMYSTKVTELELRNNGYLWIFPRRKPLQSYITHTKRMHKNVQFNFSILIICAKY